MRFLLQTDNNTGFKLSVSSENTEELKVAEELTKLLIAKIEKITVTIGHEE